MKTLMILGASIWQLPAIKKAKELGLNVIVVDMNSNAVGFKESGIICEKISTLDIQGVLRAAKKHCIDGIMTVASDMPMRTVAKIAKEMNLVGISEETAFNATNKGAMRRCLQSRNVPIPLFREVYEEDEYLEAIKSIKGKLIVKPVDNAGSRGVTLVEDITNIDELIFAYNYAKDSSRSGGIMVEEYMEGSEVSVETLSVNGECNIIQITDKITTGAPHFVEMGHSEPSMHSEKIKEQIKRIATAAVNALGIKNGPSHTEVKITTTGVKIVELGARLGGDFITTNLVPLSTGIDMIECCIKIALGEMPDIRFKYNRGSAIRYMKTNKGIIENIYGIEEAYKIHGIKEINLIHGIGEKVSEIQNSVERIGYVIAEANTNKEAIELCDLALRQIRVIVK